MPTQPSVVITVDEAAQIVKVTAPKFFREAADATVRDRLFLSLLAKKGHMSYNHDGTQFTWTVQVGQDATQTYGSGTEFTFTDEDHFQQLTSDWRGYIIAKKCNEKDQLMNGGAGVGIVNYYEKILPIAKESMRANLHAEMYIDGSASGNDNRLCGLNTFFGTTVGTTVAADLIAKNSQSYAGKTTAVGDLTTNWSTDLTTKPNASIATDWPDGSGDSDYDWNSCLQPNWSSTNWGTGSTTWLDNNEYVLRRTKMWLTKNAGMEGEPDIVIMPGHMMADFKNGQTARYRGIIPHKEAEELGFVGVPEFDGMMLKTEFDCPINTAFMLNMDQMELMCLYGQLWETEGPTWDPKTSAWLFKVKFFGNMRYGVKYQGKIKNFA